MAPECIRTTKDATEKSDVWSYGVVLWEIFSMGKLRLYLPPQHQKLDYQYTAQSDFFVFENAFNFETINNCFRRNRDSPVFA